jgi:hypothetical protein
MQKKKWGRPELIVLVRGKPDEDILVGCKNAAGSGSPGSTDSNCRIHWGTPICVSCSSTSSS